MNINHKLLHTVQAGVIGAIYVILSMFAQGFDLASGMIQCRFSEILTVLPYFTPAAIPGLAIGCFLSNLLLGSPALDVVFGTVASLIGAVGTRVLRKHKFLCTLPPVISNALIVPVVLIYGYGINSPYILLVATVGAGQFIMCVLAGSVVIRGLDPVKHQVFDANNRK